MYPSAYDPECGVGDLIAAGRSVAMDLGQYGEVNRAEVVAAAVKRLEEALMLLRGVEPLLEWVGADEFHVPDEVLCTYQGVEDAVREFLTR